MGGLYFIIYNTKTPPVNMEFLHAFMKMQHRGESDTRIVYEKTVNISRISEDQLRLHLSRREITEYTPFTCIMGFHRMGVNDLSIDASQPFEDPIMHKILKYSELRMRPKRRLICNGEIYNAYDMINNEQFSDKDLQSNSDVEVIMPMYIKYGLEEMLKKLNGDYSFVLTENINTYDLKSIQAYAVRDFLGVKPLYMVRDTTRTFYMFVSELKGIPPHILQDSNYIVEEVPPGTYWSFQNSMIEKNEQEFIQYMSWDTHNTLQGCVVNKADPQTLVSVYDEIRKRLQNAVVTRYNMTNVPVGVLVSGGFDSSIILSLLVRHLVNTNHDFTKAPVYAITMGDLDNPDVVCAKKVVEYLENKFNIDIVHHIVSIQDLSLVSNEIDNVIESLESYDPSMVRASIVYAFLMKYIKTKTEVRVLLTGEGLDELCGYHQYFELDDEEYQMRSVHVLKNMYKYDLMRADKIASRFGLELRHPFLDKSFIEYVLQIHPKLKRPQIYDYNKPPIEKYIIRKAFDDNNNDIPYLEDDILWRPLQDAVDAFSQIKQFLQMHFDSKYTDIEFYNFNNVLLGSGACDVLLPNSKEEMHYRKVFDTVFPKAAHLLSKFWKELWS